MTVAARLRQFLERRIDRDGEATALQEDALRFAGAAAEPAVPDRREGEAFTTPQDLIDRSLALKLLDGWLQNRHQIFIPLTFRFDRLDEEARATLMHFAAAVLLDASPSDRRSVADAERWLGAVKASPADLAVFAAALAAPRPLSALIAAVKHKGLEPYAYAAAVAIADTRSAAGHLFASYVAARLELPADGVRSIDRRYRR